MQKHEAVLPTEPQIGDVHSLLFQSKNGREATPFENIPDLGRAIAALPGGPYNGKEGIVTSFLRQVFNGTRPCPNEYLKAIVAATRIRMDERHLHDNPDIMISNVERAVQALKKRRERRVRDKRRPKVPKALGNAEVCFAVNAPLGELPLGSTGHKRFSSIVAENLALSGESLQPSTTYKVCYPVETDAVDLWRMIYDELIGRFGETADFGTLEPETAADRIQQAETSNQLQVYLVPYYLCLAPALIDNPDSSEDCTGVTLQLDKAGLVKTYEIRERNIAYWRQMYYDLENGVFEGFRRLDFRRYRNLVMRTRSTP